MGGNKQKEVLPELPKAPKVVKGPSEAEVRERAEVEENHLRRLRMCFRDICNRWRPHPCNYWTELVRFSEGWCTGHRGQSCALFITRVLVGVLEGGLCVCWVEGFSLCAFAFAIGVGWRGEHRLLCERRFSIFHYPVLDDEAPDYRNVVHNPMDVATLLQRVDSGQYLTKKAFLADVDLIPANAQVRDCW